MRSSAFRSFATQTGLPVAAVTENRAKVFSFLNTWSDFLTVAVIPALLATPSAALGDLVSLFGFGDGSANSWR
jgi:hypothetical protein